MRESNSNQLWGTLVFHGQCGRCRWDPHVLILVASGSPAGLQEKTWPLQNTFNNLKFHHVHSQIAKKTSPSSTTPRNKTFYSCIQHITYMHHFLGSKKISPISHHSLHLPTNWWVVINVDVILSWSTPFRQSHSTGAPHSSGRQTQTLILPGRHRKFEPQTKSPRNNPTKLPFVKSC